MVEDACGIFWWKYLFICGCNILIIPKLIKFLCHIHFGKLFFIIIYTSYLNFQMLCHKAVPSFFFPMSVALSWYPLFHSLTLFISTSLNTSALSITLVFFNKTNLALSIHSILCLVSLLLISNLIFTSFSFYFLEFILLLLLMTIFSSFLEIDAKFLNFILYMLQRIYISL